ncbi:MULTISPECIES: glycosyltransferase [unclassified Leeuwenhoekiella]|uniref:glycosyltransferase family 2 protein n=1 Tax=unclassified Leeuwenhoekiella TaxID=2615029 RepID=UPI000C5B1882|nr:MULTISPECIES: glycosyltransferase [unclassified Leeuwenhoekiella]MAW96657.1 hypothetical protein [Leeuwenhoekiella sp.]MBA81546.1 hypothetical protein [Leeuwenhoekiella sp.]|tara:strand:+ start:24811 stop:25794 length:984 start_codon:yes stop_codon:yes gene_type:complete
MPKVSIILPTYNGQAYIKEAIKSILNQTFSDFELIIVDDCSNDKTPALLEALRLQDDRIKVITNSVNQKLPASLNIGHRLANGDYLTWTSDDNKLHADFLECLVTALKTNAEDIVYSDFNVISETGEFIRVCKSGPISLLLLENGIGASFMYRKKVFERCPFNEQLHGIEDYDFWVRAAQVFRFKHIEEVLYDYRIHKASLTSQIATDVTIQKGFTNGLKIVLDNFRSLSPDTRKMLFQFQKLYDWDWDFYFKTRIKAESELQNWISKNGGDFKSFNHRYNEIIRSLLYSKATRREVLKTILAKPNILSGNYSRKTTLEIVKKLFIR